jgi:hypothetical protein
MRRILLFAAFLYFFIAPLTYHNDNKLVLFWASQNEGKVWNIWKWGETNLPPTKQFNYPPLHFFLAKLQYTVATPLAGPGFTEWLASSDTTDTQNPSLPRYMMAAKFVLILFGLLTGYFIYLLSRMHGVSERRSLFAMSLWLFNPITIYSLPMMGQNDVMAIAFFLGGWLLLQRYPRYSGIIFGLAASIKTYPLLWLAFLLPVFPGLSVQKKIFIFVTSMLVYGLTLTPFLGSPVFRTVVLNSDINDRFLISQIGIGFDQAINVVPLLLGLLFFWIFHKKQIFSFSTQAGIVMTATLLLLGFTHFHPQWYTWVIPFWALWMSQLRTTKQWLWASLLSLGALASWMLAILLFQDKYLTFGMISIFNPSLFNLPVLFEFLTLRGINVGKFDNLAHTGLAGVGLLSLVSLYTSGTSNNDETLIRWPALSFRIPKIIRFLGIVLCMLAVTFVTTLILHRVPVPLSSPVPTIETYIPIQSPIQIPVIGVSENLTRFDLYLRNPQLENTGAFEITLYDREIKTLLLQQQISGRNVGDYTTLRIDLPAARSNSRDTIYDLSIAPIEGTQSAELNNGALPKDGEGYVLIGKSGEGEDDIAVVTYYTSEVSSGSVLTRSIERIQLIVSQIWLYMIAVFILLFLAA